MRVPQVDTHCAGCNRRRPISALARLRARAPAVVGLNRVSAPSDDTARSRSLVAFTGGGIFFFWQVGASLALAERLPMSSLSFSGVSAGALSAVLCACDVDLLAAVDSAYKLSVDAGVYERKLGLVGVWGPLVERWLHDLLPADAVARCEGRVELVHASLWPPSRFVARQHATKDELVNSAMASVHLPFLLDGRATRRFKGRPCVDGSVLASRDVVATRRPEGAPTLLVDHNDDLRIARARKMGDIVELTTRDGLQRFVDMGYGWMSAELASGRMDAFLEAAGGR